MPIVQLMISPTDEEGSRRKAGDIVDVLPEDGHFGFKEYQHYLIVPVESDFTAEELRQMIKKDLLETGEDSNEVDREIFQQQEERRDFIINYAEVYGSDEVKAIATKVKNAETKAKNKEKLLPQEKIVPNEAVLLQQWIEVNGHAAADAAGKTVRERPARAAKNKYRIHPDDLKQLLPELDHTKAMNPDKLYQPFLTASKVVARFNGAPRKDGSKQRSIEVDDPIVDTGDSREENFIISKQDFNKIFQLKDHTKPQERKRMI